jgi:hypothetical protein
MTTNERLPRRPSHQRQPPQGGNAIAVPLLEPLPRSKAPNGGAYKRNEIGQPRALRSARA